MKVSKNLSTMKKRGSFSPERLFLARRLRKARRFYKNLPLFAFEMMKEEYPGYRYPDFLDDLRRRSPPKKKRPKNGLCRYGRFLRMQELLSEYVVTGEIECARKATQLRKHMSKPYRVRITIGRRSAEYTFSPLISIHLIEELVNKLNNCKTESQADTLVEEFWNNSHIK